MKWLKKLFNRNMYNDQIIERLMTYKSMYQGNKFQWVKDYPPGMAAAVASVLDIEPGRGDQIMVLLSNNHRVTIEQLNSSFQMVSEEMPALSVAEVMSINDDPGLSPEIQQAVAEVKPKVDPREGLTESKSYVPAQTDDSAKLQVPGPVINPTNIFGMFSLNPTKLRMDIEVKLPAMNLMKAMYAESADKEDFLQKVAQYVHQTITVDSVRDAVLTKLGPIKSQK